MKISVVIPTYNRKKELQLALLSVQKQTFRDLEIIVVSDGSKDGTDEIMKEQEKQDSRIQYISYPESKGGNFARNCGIKRAQGDYIAFLDDDDIWEPEKLKKQLQVFEADSKVGLVCTGGIAVWPAERVEYKLSARQSGDLKKKILISNSIGTTSTVMVKRTVLDQAEYFDEKLPALQDYDLWIRICQIADVGVVEEPLIRYYNERKKVQISGSTQRYEKALSYITEKYRTLLGGLTDEEKKARDRASYTLLMNKAFRNGEGKKARAYGRKIMKLKFSPKVLVTYFFSFFDYSLMLKVRAGAGN